MIDAVGEALYERELTREELAVEVVRRTRSKKFGEALRESWGGVLKTCSFQGVLCFAPGESQRVRFTNPRSWLGGDQSGPPANEALREVVRRFLVTYGPTSREEVARWWAGSFSPTSAEKLIRSIGDEVTPVDIDGTDAWALTEHLEGIRSAEPARAVRLLPAFDQYVIGSTKHAVDPLPGDFRDRVHRKAGWVSPVLLVDGRFEGVWSHARTGKRVSVTVEPSSGSRRGYARKSLSRRSASPPSLVAPSSSPGSVVRRVSVSVHAGTGRRDRPEGVEP